MAHNKSKRPLASRRLPTINVTENVNWFKDHKIAPSLID